MRDLIFTLIDGLLRTCTKFQGEDGTVRVYDFPITGPAGYPYVVIGSSSLESNVLDTASDVRRYNYTLQIVGEKFGDEAGLSQTDALAAMRKTEDAVLTILDAHNCLGRQDVVIRVMPTQATYGTTDGGTRIILNISVSVDVRVLITAA